jgi:hypothetical protein
MVSCASELAIKLNRKKKKGEEHDEYNNTVQVRAETVARPTQLTVNKSLNIPIGQDSSNTTFIL